MIKYKLKIEYNGTRYSGWQEQKNSDKTIQGKILNALSQLFGNTIEFIGSGRTDSGVHAIEQVAHLVLEKNFLPQKIQFGLNDLLPSDINILNVEKVDLKFHARYNAKSRIYVYQIAKRRTAFGKEFCWWIKDELNFSKMQTASQQFVGMHNFVSFCDKRFEKSKSTKCLIEKIEMKETDNFILIRTCASHFLWKMVRRIVGTLVEVGRENILPTQINYFLSNEVDDIAKFTAPPSGLFLEKITYDEKKITKELNPLFFF